MSSLAHKIVEAMLDGPDPEPDDIDPKAETLSAMDAHQEMHRLGIVNQHTVGSGQTLWHHTEKNSDGTAARVKVTSVKTWKRQPDYFEIGWKHGLYSYGKITPSNASEWTSVEPPAVPRARKRR